MLFIKAEKAPGGRGGGKNGLEKKSFFGVKCRLSSRCRDGCGQEIIAAGMGLKQATIIRYSSKHDVESIGSRVESIASLRESIGSRVESVASRVELVGSNVESIASRVESVGSSVESIASRVESVGSAGHFGADYAELLGFFDKVEFDPWPEPPNRGGFRGQFRLVRQERIAALAMPEIGIWPSQSDAVTIAQPFMAG
jgi:hypothetical protein